MTSLVDLAKISTQRIIPHRPAKAKGHHDVEKLVGGAWLGTVKAKDRVITTLCAAGPLNDWLTGYFG